MTVLLVPILQATHCVLLSLWPEIGVSSVQRVLVINPNPVKCRISVAQVREVARSPVGCLADSPALDSTLVGASENAIKIVVRGDFAAFIRL
jgi:hypothetical protein